MKEEERENQLNEGTYWYRLTLALVKKKEQKLVLCPDQRNKERTWNLLQTC
jgi:hypothetical protein